MILSKKIVYFDGFSMQIVRKTNNTKVLIRGRYA